MISTYTIKLSPRWEDKLKEAWKSHGYKSDGVRFNQRIETIKALDKEQPINKAEGV